MSGQVRTKRVVARGNGEKAGNGESEQGVRTLVVKLSWYRIKRGRKSYYYPKLNLPAETVEQLSIKPLEHVEFEVRLEQRGGQQVIVLVPQKKAVHA